MNNNKVGLEFSSVSFAYDLDGGKVIEVVDKFALDVEPRNFVVLLGPSGCGKSTLLRLGAGLIQPDSGTICTTDGSALLDECVYLPQRNTLFPWLSALDNILFALRHNHPSISAKDLKSQASWYLSEVGLGQAADSYPLQLSGGQQQRVSLARTFASGRAILLLDEPFTALDQLTKWKMQELLVGLYEQHRHTVLVVTHDVEEAIYLAEDLVILSDRPTRPLWRGRVPFERPRSEKLRTSHDFVDFRRIIERRLRATDESEKGAGLFTDLSEGRLV